MTIGRRALVNALRGAAVRIPALEAEAESTHKRSPNIRRPPRRVRLI